MALLSEGDARMWRTEVPLVVALAAACGPATHAPSQPQPAAPDKRSLYGDAGLVPTRDGEHARRELAVAGEIMAAARTLPAIAEIHVDVELPREEASEPRVLVAARLAHEGAGQEATKRALANVIRGAVGQVPDGAAVYVLSDSEFPAQPASRPPLALLGVCLIGLGLSAGVALERARTRGRTRRPARPERPSRL